MLAQFVKSAEGRFAALLVSGVLIGASGIADLLPWN